MYQAPIVALLILVTHIWGHAGLALERKGFIVPLSFHHYGFMYLMLFYLFFAGCQSMYEDVMVPSAWLDGPTTEAFVNETMNTNNEGPEVMELWRNESTLGEFQGLKEFSMLCPVFVLLTMLVCVWHTHMHVNKIRWREGGAGLLCNSPEHDQTIKVLILPVIYGLMSFKSTQRMWQVMINHVPVPGHAHDITAVAFNGYVERKSFLLEMYDANFMVGDIYETIALVTFGNLVMGVLKKKIDKMKEIFAVETNERGDGKEMQEYINRLVDAMKTLTVAGVKLFAMSCLMQGCYTLTITTLAFDFPDFRPDLFSRSVTEPGRFQTETMKATAHSFFLGAGFVASFAAIGNIMIIEEDFEELLKEFYPALKFWGTKILVSLAFLQSILISMFLTPRGWSEIQSNLFYSSALCLECLLIAIFHIKGWSADEIWYGDYDITLSAKTAKKGMKQPLLPTEAK